MTIQFSNFRLSFIWVETIPAIAAQQLETFARYTFLGEPGGYAAKFNALQQQLASKADVSRGKKADVPQGGGEYSDLHLPWRSAMGNNFWKYYFGNDHAGNVTGAKAWEKHVPLRRTTLNIKHDAPGLEVTFELFYSSHGVGLVANVYYRGENRPLDAIVTLSHAVRYKTQFHTAAGTKGLSLQGLADHVLQDARQHAFGDVTATQGFNQPFTVATFVQGEAGDLDVEVPEGGSVHRALEALTAWNLSPNLDKATIGSARLPIKKRRDSDLVYARARGRAIWLPRQFAVANEANSPPRLSCYHRNMTLASLQTMNLGEFVDLVGGKLSHGEQVPPLLLVRAKSANRVLKLLASADRNDRKWTYRSMSIDAQVKAAGWDTSMKTVGV
jgi:hypothetical protein